MEICACASSSCHPFSLSPTPGCEANIYSSQMALHALHYKMLNLLWPNKNIIESEETHSNSYFFREPLYFWKFQFTNQLMDSSSLFLYSILDTCTISNFFCFSYYLINVWCECNKSLLKLSISEMFLELAWVCWFCFYIVNLPYMEMKDKHFHLCIVIYRSWRRTFQLCITPFDWK